MQEGRLAMNPATIFLWLTTHWWIFLLAAIALTAAGMWAGLVSIAKVIVALLKACAAIAEFFTTPKEQIAPKVLCCIAFFCFGATPGFYYGKRVVTAEWTAADARAEKQRKDLDRAIDDAAEKKADEANQRIADLEKKLNEKVRSNEAAHPECVFTDADIGGVRNDRKPRTRARDHR